MAKRGNKNPNRSKASKGTHSPEGRKPELEIQALNKFADKSGVDQFSRLKKRFLASKAIAVLLLVMLAVSNLKELGEVKDYFFPYKRMIATSIPKNVETGVYKTIALKLNVSVNSEKQFLFNDAIANLSFFKEDNGKYVGLRPEEGFFGEYNKLLPPFDNAANKADVLFNLRCINVGDYLIVAEVKSKESALHARDSFFIKVTEYDLEDLNASQKIPVFVLRDSILDTSPKFLSELDGIKIIVWEEAEKTDVAKSTIQILPDYIGAAGGMCYSVYRNLLTLTNPGSSEKESDHKDRKDAIVNYGLKSAGIISLVSDETFVPIGDNLYSIKLLDEHRLAVNKVYLESDTLVAGKWIENFEKSTKDWELPEYNIQFQTEFSPGAAGRNLSYSLHLQGKTFEYIDRIEFTPEPPVNDFPLFMHTNYSFDSKEFLKFVRTSSDSLIICRFKNVK